MVSVTLPWDFPGGPQMIENLPAAWETRVQSLGQENPLVKEWLPTPVFFPVEFHGSEEPGRLQSTGSQRVGNDWATNTFTFQWLRLGLPTQGVQVQSLVWELEFLILCGQKPIKHQKQQCNEFNKDTKNGPHKKKSHLLLFCRVKLLFGRSTDGVCFGAFSSCRWVVSWAS